MLHVCCFGNYGFVGTPATLEHLSCHWFDPIDLGLRVRCAGFAFQYLQLHLPVLLEFPAAQSLLFRLFRVLAR